MENESVTTSKLADGSVTGEKLAAESIRSCHLEAGSVTADKLAPGVLTISNSIGKIEEGGIIGLHLADEAVTSGKIAPQSINSVHLSAGSINEEHLNNEIINGTHIQASSINTDKLAFIPVTASGTKRAVLQQFGIAEFRFQGQEHLQIMITFDTPFTDEQFSFVAMSNHPACYTVLHSKEPTGAIVSIIRTRIGPEPIGFINWIAIG